VLLSKLSYLASILLEGKEGGKKCSRVKLEDGEGRFDREVAVPLRRPKETQPRKRSIG
jgi:hypothetical protein